MAVGRRQQADEESRLFHIQLGGRGIEVKAGSILKPESHAEVNPVEVAQQQLRFAEAAFELQGHQEFAPLAFERVALTHQVGVQASGQLLGQAAASFQNLSTGDVGEQGTQGADGVDSGMPPETVVLAGQQGVDQGR